MKSITLSPVLVISSLVLLVGLASTDAYFAVKVAQQRNQLDAIVGRQGTSMPKVGLTIPVLSGKNLKTGSNYSIVPVASPPLALLVFKESCHYCAVNWKNWEALFADGKLHVYPILVTSDQVLSDSYRKSHPLLGGPRVILGVDPKLLGALNLTATPQTVFLVHGKVQKAWLGVLSDKDVQDIRNAMSKEPD